MFLFALVYTAGTVSGMYGRGFGFLGFAMLVVALIAECVVSKGSLSGIGQMKNLSSSGGRFIKLNTSISHTGII